MCWTPYLFAMRRACVPLPAPTGPRRTTSSGLSANEASVVAHDELRFELTHRVERNTNHDQHGGARNGQRLKARGAFDEVRQYGHDTEEEGASDRDSNQYGREV